MWKNIFVWLRGWESNPRPFGYEPKFLPLDDPAIYKHRRIPYCVVCQASRPKPSSAKFTFLHGYVCYHFFRGYQPHAKSYRIKSLFTRLSLLRHYTTHVGNNPTFFLEQHTGFEPVTPVWKTGMLPLNTNTANLVRRVGVEPTMFLMSRVYSPLQSPLCTPTHI